ncbi:SusC/RagA family TonB-linked outer membrane protein [Chryseobacterium sp. JUb7]|uniref:SusC/RagA family TonB-linked outer membrane protein n=1 Tax=Chryseobacterium sp. JUb7 TaxID=2940599 RepID=UPI0021683F4B|nr:SusC/RagA family TonB-linked outer membrane protein [Chryseobacterium sp. JUb7]MCS3529330.1 TonB-linked SusC/RagA family outer membrane protein [Chryseobacterium sp. JUb7]
MKKFVASILMVCGAVSIHAQTSSEKKDSIDVQSIEEVVVTSSYGTKKLKEEVVGSIVTLTDKDISTSQPFESIDKMIAGLAPGVQIVNNSELGKPVSINIRGLGSLVPINGNFGTSTQPLIIVDGVIIREDNGFDQAYFDGSEANSELNINPLARFNSDNIESINILKDAAAVALYGAEAANGVILITTKKGRKGKATYSFSTQYGVSQSINKVKYLNGQQYAQLYNDYLKNNNASSSGYPWNGTDVNWFEVMNGNGDFSRTNFTTSGGNKYFTYRVGLDYSKNNESKVLNSLEKKGIDASVGFDYKKLKISLYTAYNNFEKDQPNTYFNFILAPVNKIYNDDGSYASSGFNGNPNPLQATTQNISNVKNNSLISSLNVSYELAKGLKVSSLFGADLSYKNNVNWKSGLNESGITGKNFGKSRINTSDSKKWNWSTHLYYEKDFLKKHHADILIGMELRHNKDYKEVNIGTNFEDFANYQLPWNSINTPIFKALTEENSGRSFFSQLNYDFNKKYFLSATIRRDESSAFGKDINATLNGGIGASWLISKENFLSNNKVLSFLRLRASWGMTGNSRIGSYRSSGLYKVSYNGFDYNYDYAYPDTSSPPNRELSWERNEKINLGLDFSILKILDFTVEVYRNNISDMILNRDVPPETGYGSAEINGAAMYNQGIEFSMRGNWFTKKNFKWNTTFNIATVKNKVTDLFGLSDKFSSSTLARAQKIGSPTSAIWGYQWMGVNPANGLDTYLVNGELKDYGQFTANNELQYTIIGNTQPDFTGGLSNRISYKNLSMTFLINFEWGGDALVGSELIDKYSNLVNRNMSVNALDYWMVPGDIAENRKPTSKTTIPNTSKYVYDNSHVKLQNVNINYQLPLSTIKNSFIKNASIFIDCTNVLYWYKEKSPTGKNGIREFRYLYPEMRTFSFGFKANF